MTLWDWLFSNEPGEARQQEQIARSVETVVDRELRVLEEVKRTNLEAHDKLQDLIEEMRKRRSGEGQIS